MGTRALALLGASTLLGGCLERTPLDGDATIPDVDACASVSDWPLEWELWERDVLERVNDARTSGLECGPEFIRPVAPLTFSGALTCAARNHAVDMATREYFDHTDPDGLGPEDRVAITGVPFLEVHESIAAGTSPAQTADLWLHEEGGCSALLFEGFDRVGVGYDDGLETTYDGFWVMLLGRSEAGR